MTKWLKGKEPYTIKCPFCKNQFYSATYKLDDGFTIVEKFPECPVCKAKMEDRGKLEEEGE